MDSGELQEEEGSVILQSIRCIWLTCGRVEVELEGGEPSAELFVAGWDFIALWVFPPPPAPVPLSRFQLLHLSYMWLQLP